MWVDAAGSGTSTEHCGYTLFLTVSQHWDEHTVKLTLSKINSLKFGRKAKLIPHSTMTLPIFSLYSIITFGID